MPGSADGTGDAARFDTPQDIVIDATGNLFVADTRNHTIRKITPAGNRHDAGRAAAKISGNIDGNAGAARFSQPLGIAIDPAGNLFVTEEGNGTIRKITPAGAVSTYASCFQFRDPYYYAIAVDAGREPSMSSASAFRDYRNAYDSTGHLQGDEIVSRHRICHESGSGRHENISVQQTTCDDLSGFAEDAPLLSPTSWPRPPANWFSPWAGARRVRRLSLTDVT